MQFQAKKILLILLAGLVSSCSKNEIIYAPRLGSITDDVISQLKESNPIIVVPGVGGTSLVDASNGKPAWGSIGYTTYWPSTEKENKLLALPLTNNKGKKGKQDNKLIPFSMLENVTLTLLPFASIDLAIYSTIVSSLEKAGYIRYKNLVTNNLGKSQQTPPLFEFAYDWRMSNADSARELNKFVEKKSNELKARKSSYGDQKFNIVCHSMGCLVARYYLRYGGQGLGTSTTHPKLDWRGSQKIENIIMVAPPNKGSMDAFTNLVNGFHPNKIAWLKYPAVVLGTMPSMYELLPTEDIADASNQKGEKVNLLDPELWQDMGWGLLDPDQSKVLHQIGSEISTKNNVYIQAKLLQAKLLRQANLFHSRLDLKVKPPAGLGFYLFAGIGEPTESGLLINTVTKSWSVKSSDAGDGAVLKASAYAIRNANNPDEGSIIPWDNAIFFFSNHMDLVKNNDLFANLYDILIWRDAL